MKSQLLLTHQPRPPGLGSPYLLILVLTVLTFTFAIMSTLKHETADEGFHTPVVYMWYNGQFEKPENLTVLPVYHAIIAGLLHVMDLNTVKSMRFLTLLLASISIPLFYFLSKLVHSHSSDADTRTLMYVLSPIILPFFSLVYTDMPAMALILAFIFLMLKGWHWAAGGVALFAAFFRQPTLVWTGFCGLFLLVHYWLAHSEPWKQRIKIIAVKHYLVFLPYALVFCAVAAFAIYNKGLSAGDTDLQKVTFNPSNIYFYLLLTFFLFLPYNFEYSQRIYQLISKSYKPWIYITLLFFVFFFTYSNSHQYNSYGLSFYLRNILLHFTVTNFALKVLAFIAMTWMALTYFLMAQDSKKPWQLYVLYFSTFVCLVPLPLVEQRYYIPALTLFLIWKPATHPVSDRLILIGYIPLSAAILYGIAQHKFFL